MDHWKFNSRRSAALGRHACVSSDQPLASKVGIDILQAGGNAADAAVAMSAVLGLVMPEMSGLGGDCFAIFRRACDGKVMGLNGSARSPSQLTLEMVKSKGFNKDNPIPTNHGMVVTVPGAVSGMIDCLERFGSGKFFIADVLAPAILLAEEGFPVSEVTAHYWEQCVEALKKSRNGSELLIDKRAPKAGEIMKNSNLASTLKAIAKNGKAGFYSGFVAEQIVNEVQYAGGCMTLEDLYYHMTSHNSLVEPISTNFQNFRLWELPPNTQGMVAIMALNILDGFNLKSMGHNSADYIHVVSEALRIAFADSLLYLGDPYVTPVPLNELLSKNYATKRRKYIQLDKVISNYDTDALLTPGSDTTYLAVVDEQGNACSFITSVLSSFGSTLVPNGCGFPLNNRGSLFSLEEDSPNVIGPRKLPLHTIIPGLLTDAIDDSFQACLGVMGRWMQPQGHVQVLLNMLVFGMDPQTALNEPRFFIGQNEFFKYRNTLRVLLLEEGIKKSVIQDLRNKGHNVHGFVEGYDRSIFGRGHIIAHNHVWDSSNNSDCESRKVLWGGADPRLDGISIAY